MAAPFTLYKLIILYMLKNSESPLSNSQISEFILEREYTGYFQLQQAISELLEAELITMHTVSNTSYYQLSEDGSNTLKYFADELSPEIKNEVRQYLRKNGQEIQERILTPADFYPTGQGSYAVRCQIAENNVAVLDLTFTAPSQDAAKAICENWPDKCQNIYTKIMEELL